MAKSETKPPRERTAKDVEFAILANCARRCALCFHLNGDLQEKLGQIAHLDSDRSNGSESNLAFLCLAHHSLFDSTTSQHKNYTVQEVKDAKSRLCKLVAEGEHLTPASALPYLQLEADKRTFREFLDLLPSTGAIRFLKQHSFGNSFRSEFLDPIETFVADRQGPDYEFLDTDLEAARRAFLEICETLIHRLSGNVYNLGNGFIGVPPEWAHEQPARYNAAVKTLDELGDKAWASYVDFVRLVRNRLAV
jgi:hypothetical protein